MSEDRRWDEAEDLKARDPELHQPIDAEKEDTTPQTVLSESRRLRIRRKRTQEPKEPS